MTRGTSRRRAVLALPALLAAAALSALIALGGAGGGRAAVADAHAAHQSTGSGQELELRQDVRKLWEDHVTWTRMTIVDFAAGLPSLPASEARLLRNQSDIGRAITPYYGKPAGARLTALLREHILIAVDVLTAAKAGDAQGLAQAQARWTGNADRIAAFLAGANPAWPRAEMRGMMRRHLKLTTDEAVARLTGDLGGDVRAYDRVHVQILRMADMLSSGIVSQFPDRFDR